MSALAFALWGLFGAAAVEGLQFNNAVRRLQCWPWLGASEPSFGPWLTSVFIRLGVGSGLALAAGSTGQVSGAFGALAVGVAAPYIIEQLSRSASVVNTTPAAIELAEPSVLEPAMENEQITPSAPVQPPDTGQRSSGTEG
ncbi:hypothetical protein [Nocardiopsis trehalosi]|uniref:hypothetical protein n=1 Tax=Nocardiopsis trehalosi TaxID=109329 RepID=UPI0012FA5C79|nr:hypothetical protein [Nocardiopsis trehalosi]